MMHAMLRRRPPLRALRVRGPSTVALLLVFLAGFAPAGLARESARTESRLHLAAGPEAQCPIAGLVKYAIGATRSESACSLATYIRACADAQESYRIMCQDFCGAFKTRDGRTQCEGRSEPYGELFDPDHHCDETRRQQFDVTCSVSSECFCEPIVPEGAAEENPAG